MNNNIEQHVKQALESLDGMEKAKANPFLYGKVMHRMQDRPAEQVYNGKVVLRYVMMILVLAGLNVATLYLLHPSRHSGSSMEMERMAQEYSTATVFEYEQ